MSHSPARSPGLFVPDYPDCSHAGGPVAAPPGWGCASCQPLPRDPGNSCRHGLGVHSLADCPAATCPHQVGNTALHHTTLHARTHTVTVSWCGGQHNWVIIVKLNVLLVLKVDETLLFCPSSVHYTFITFHYCTCNEIFYSFDSLL